MIKIIVADDEIAALSTFLPSVVDGETECKMFMREPRAALEYVRRNAVDAAFLDVVMPETDGVTLAERLVSIRPDIKIIFISAYPQNEKEIAARIGDNLMGFCYKPYDREKLTALLAAISAGSEKSRVYLRTFDAFDLFVDGKAVNFGCAKAKELLALLCDACGSYVTMDTAVGNLWADKNAESGKRLYRDAVCRLRFTLKDAGVADLVTFERARAVINTRAARCDMWDYVHGGGVFSGRYMPQYGWSILTESALEQMKK